MTYLTLPHEDDAPLVVEALREHAAALRHSAQVGLDSMHVNGRMLGGPVPRETQQVVQAGSRALLAHAQDLDDLAAHVEEQLDDHEDERTEPAPCSCHARQR